MTLIERIEQFTRKECGNGATQDQLARAQAELGVVFPGSYKEFLRKYGWGEFATEAIYGLGHDVPKYLDVVRQTLRERTELEPRLPLALVPVMNDGAGNNYCLDTSKLIHNECPVVLWNHEMGGNQVPETVAASFDNWFCALLDRLSPADK
jgi:cell wall assembly regulator SMI1